MSSENKGADQLHSVTAKLICAFVFAYADCWFSHAAAQIMLHLSLNALIMCSTAKFVH